MRFIEYLMRPEVVDELRHRAERRSRRSTARRASDPALAATSCRTSRSERLVGFTDHQIPPSIPLQPINQPFLIDGDQDGLPVDARRGVGQGRPTVGPTGRIGWRHGIA